MHVRYTADHEWVMLVEDVATVGVTDYAQRTLGELVFIELPVVGSTIARGAVAAVVESVKAASDIFAPLSGSILAVNTAAVSDPPLVNTDPMGAGWLFKMQWHQAGELSSLLDELEYQKLAK